MKLKTFRLCVGIVIKKKLNMNDLLECTKCKARVHPEQMSKDSRRRCGLSSWCKECRKVSSRTWARNNPEKVQAQAERQQPKPYKTAREYLLKYRYNLSLDGYDQMLTAQNFSCALCQKEKDYDLYVDHCHTTGKVRGLLCATCNSILGFCNDNVELLKRSIDYLKK